MSFVIKEKSTGSVICELFDIQNVKRLNTEKYEAVPIVQHLASLSVKPPVEEAEETTSWTNHYSCPCGEHWDDTHDCCSNDRCPSCNKEIEPYISDDGSLDPEAIEAAFDALQATRNGQSSLCPA